ncbi:MAG: hypothetical protein HOV68_20620 [Streptomycetaceae bacterium]|nr:hypothetical protein [Streptomycetaceae bacterium]
MRSNKLVAVAMGTVLLGVTAASGAAAAHIAETTPIPAAGAEEAAPPAVPAADPADARTRAMAEVRTLIEKGVPGASPELDTRLKGALRTAERAVESARTARQHTSAGQAHSLAYPHVWPFAARADVPPPPEIKLDALLEAVKSLDIGKVLDALNEVLNNVLSAVTDAIGSAGDTAAGAKPEIPDVQVPDIQMPEIPQIQIPDIPEPEIPQLPDLSKLDQDLHNRLQDRLHGTHGQSADGTEASTSDGRR